MTGGCDTGARDERARPAGFTVNDDERLLLDVIEALRGADNLRERLLAALHAGTPAVADLAYAVKARVKEDYKAVDKIKDRRKGNLQQAPRPGYCISDVTDLVGLRIITLYRLDALEVIQALLETINGDRSTSAAFVAGSISEVKIYSTNSTGDVQKLPHRLLELFTGAGLGAVTQIEEKPSNYSSIHILVRGRGKYRDGYREVPVEIQVRTALEDAWGQIEHSLKYKRKTLAESGAASETDRRLETTLSHLGALKTMIDGIAQYGDQIKLQIDELEPELRSSSSRSAEEPSVRLASLRDLPDEVRAEVAAAFAEALPGLIDLSLPANTRMRALRSGLAKLDGVADQEATLSVSAKSRRELRYVVNMHRALLHFQLGNLLDHGEAQLKRALDLYNEMEKAFPARIVILYRKARALDAIGRRDEAITAFRGLLARLEDKGGLPDDHWIRSAAPRNLGVLLWEAASARAPLDDTAMDPDALDLLREAILLTGVAQRAHVTDDPLAPSGSTERTKAINNLLYYLIEYLEAGGEPRAGMDDAAVKKAVRSLAIKDFSQITSLSVGDTLRRVFAYLKDKPAEYRVAQRIIELSSVTTGPRTPIVREAVRIAERIVAEPRPAESETAPPSAEAPGPKRRARRSTRGRQAKDAGSKENGNIG